MIKVNFSKSGIIADWNGEHDNLLDLALANGLEPEYKCLSSSCQTCATPIKKGAVIYDPEPFFEPEEGNVLICCSSPAEDIDLDL